MDVGDEWLGKLISESQILIGNIPSITAAAKATLEKWDDTQITSATVGNAISIMCNARKIGEFRNECDRVCEYDTITSISSFESQKDYIVQLIGMINNIAIKNVLSGPKKFVAKEIGSFFASLEWDANERDSEYSVAIVKENDNWESRASFSFTENKVAITTLEPESTYKMYVLAKRNNLATEWSDALVISTPPNTFEVMADTLKSHCSDDSDATICAKSLGQIVEMTKGCKY